MNTIQLVIVQVSTLLVIAIYYGIYRLVADESASGRLAIQSVLWGILVRLLFFFVIAPIVITTGLVASSERFIQLGAPIIGEILKAVYLYYLFSRRQIRSFLNGALYGAAVGVGLAIEFALESLVVPSGTVEGTLLSSLTVLLSNNTVRAITGAMVGFGVGMAYFQRTALHRWLWMAGGLLVAIIWGTTYSHLGTLVAGGLLFAYAFIYSVSGVGLMLAAGRTAQLAQAFRQIREEKKRADALIHGVIPLGAALSAERDFARLLETIISEARSFANADGSTLFLRTSSEQLEYVVIHNQSLGLTQGGASGGPVTFDPLPLLEDGGQPDLRHIASYIVHKGQSVNVEDVHDEAAGLSFAGPQAFDAQTGYRTQSVLSVPLKSQAGEVIGVLQLVNARSDLTGETVSFDASTQQIIESLSALAAAALTSYIRIESLRAQSSLMHVKVDSGERDKQLSEITESEFFRELQSKLGEVRRRKTARMPTDAPTKQE